MTTFLAFGLPGGSEWFIIFLIVVLLFGAKKLPELARGVGRSLAEFQKARTDVEREINKAADDIEEEKKQASTSSITNATKKS